MTPAFWAGKRVLLTGHTGFKGSWLAAWLARHGAKVHGFALPPDKPRSLFEDAGLAARIESTLGDIRRPEELRAAFAHAQPEIVLHLAAQSLVRPSFEDPVGTFETNVMGTVHVLEACRATASVRAIVNVTSDKCYDNREVVWPYREDEPMGGSDPYSASKGCSELVTAAWRKSFIPGKGAKGPARMVLASARAGNVIGGGDWARDRLIPDCVRAIEKGEAIVLRNPNSVRPWQHVLEPLSGYLLLAERLHQDGEKIAEGWNFGPRDDCPPRTVSWVVERFVAAWGGGAQWKLDAAPNPPEANLLRVDSSKAAFRLGWSPRLDTPRAVEWTMDWYRRHHAGERAGVLLDEQIAAYEALPQCP
jgi:CDP-glucose 4,6-dehydratase